MPDPIYDFATAVGARVEPTPSVKTSGAVPGQPFGAGEFNDLIGRLSDWVKLMSEAGADKFDIEHDSADGTHSDINADSVTSDSMTLSTPSFYRYASPKAYILRLDPAHGGWFAASGDLLYFSPDPGLAQSNPSESGLWRGAVSVPIVSGVSGSSLIQVVQGSIRASRSSSSGGTLNLTFSLLAQEFDGSISTVGGTGVVEVTSLTGENFIFTLSPAVTLDPDKRYFLSISYDTPSSDRLRVHGVSLTLSIGGPE